MKIHHRKAHGFSIAYVRDLECEWCGAKLKPRYEYDVSEHNFCHGTNCESQWQSERVSNNPPSKDEIVRAKISRGNTGKTIPQEQRDKISETKRKQHDNVQS